MTNEIMTNEEAINTLKSLKQYYNDKNEDSYVGFDAEDNKSIDMAIRTLEQQPCEDCVSRQSLIDKATSWDTHFTDSERAVSLTDIMSLPSVTPSIKDWLSTFNTDSATECFTAVQELKKEIENGHIGKE